MTIKMLIAKYKKEAKRLEKQSKDTYDKLETGELPQEDDIIYSVYEDAAQAVKLKSVVNDLEKLELGK